MIYRRYSLPKGKLYTQSVLNRYFILYAVISFGVPIIPLLLAWAYGVTGIPVYYIKGLHTTNESIKSSGKYFIPPVLFLLLLCFVKLLIVSYGFYRNYPKSKAKHENHEGSGIRFEEYVKAKQVYVQGPSISWGLRLKRRSDLKRFCLFVFSVPRVQEYCF